MLINPASGGSATPTQIVNGTAQVAASLNGQIDYTTGGAQRHVFSGGNVGIAGKLNVGSINANVYALDILTSTADGIRVQVSGGTIGDPPFDFVDNARGVEFIMTSRDTDTAQNAAVLGTYSSHPVVFIMGTHVAAQVDRGSGAGTLGGLFWDVDKSALSRLVVGAADSGGAGFRMVRVAN